MNKAKIIKVLSLTLTAITFVFISGNFVELSAQAIRDPFRQNPVKRKKKTKRGGTSKTKKASKPKKKGPFIVEAPSIETRIEYFKKIRMQAANSGMQVPKVTSVLLLNEMTVTGIFKTPRGYAAMIKAKPINLSFTIYPGEKFFDGQLVAVEENGLVFRKVTKWNTGKFVTSVENKTLRKYSNQQTIQGTAPTGSYTPKPQSAKNKTPKKEVKTIKPASPAEMISPLEEMNRKPAEEPKDSAKKDSKSKKRASLKKGVQ